MNLASIPSPTTAVWHLGPVPIRAYALCIIAGIIAACFITDRRMRARGVQPWVILDVAVYAVPFGIIGARIYHVISSPQGYFGEGGEPIKALYIWEGGLGIWGAVAGGALGAWLACRQLRLPFALVADTLAVGLPVAQGIGRLGNWFNNELHGGHTDLPWGLEVHQMGPNGQAEVGPAPDNAPQLLEGGPFHPTFLYELIWDLGIAGVVLWADRKYKFGKGRAFALYVMLYTLGRGVIESIRTDEATVIGPWRINVWVSIIVFLAALIYFVRVKGPREYVAPLAEGRGYQVLTEEEFTAYRETGVVPEIPVVEELESDADEESDDASPSGGDSPGDDDAPAKSKAAEKG
ncbi:prolipoprotein diacylglyceryl transferase [Allocatelliglobosispora scoriae]|uniref:Phosphatidylglycerol--prolipoprotein diacylglyceryl transferase n=1 Tax=Allocatelliglobosispora scoriae TaxID=643052 RepID=A0A841BQ57_9ACTN|nr:prolipoprotein diacylglyceryl transferase [Allocatelliglobosispora scoriae]MBB5869319.1 prolipoprotein diacylglyceryl transferase [Allocatelliglobosispora scoriae]